MESLVRWFEVGLGILDSARKRIRLAEKALAAGIFTGEKAKDVGEFIHSMTLATSPPS